uniref:uncharacterized protein LOC124066459 n=1 Tax=Scatophagus argus TaxID=75038 RepID=UPI001ED83723|nr:uncharacterized protein LOC124066459 [Scatophagus argus]
MCLPLDLWSSFGEPRRMERLLVEILLVSLVTVSFGTGDFCYQKQCPQYELIEKNQDFEKRLYVATRWLTTKIESTASSDLIAASSRLKDYCNRCNGAGYEIPTDTWPVLITVTHDLSWLLSWFVPPGTRLPENPVPSVTVESKPESMVYVRVFGGTPSIESGQENANALWAALDKNCTDLPIHSGACYESYFALQHHNEIWIYAHDICNNNK